MSVSSLKRLILETIRTTRQLARMASHHSSASLISPNPSDLLVDRVGHAGILTLNRPHAHNAITHYMTVELGRQLRQWRDDSSVALVILKGSGGKAFAAGGDVKELTDTAKKDHSSSHAFQFLVDEFSTQHLIGTYTKPIVALAHGFCMGGGCGVAVNSRYTVATERTVLAMPETIIGFFPDNGGAYFLSHLKGELGTYLGLTSAQLKGSDAYHAGLATHYISSQSLPLLESELLSLTSPSHDSVKEILNGYHEMSIKDSPSFSLSPHLSTITNIFSENRMETVIQKLKELNTEWSTNTLNALNRCSPTALKITLRILHECKHLDLGESLALELQAGRAILQNPDSDFFRGVQALLVEKNNDPQWQPNNISQVTDKIVEKYFKSLESADCQKFLAKL